MLEKLEAVEERYDSIERMMADPEVAVDFSRVQVLAKEQAGIKTLVSLARKIRSLSAEIAEVRTLLGSEGDNDIVVLARAEISELEERLDKVNQELRLELLPKDPSDDKNVIMEIRAATGGDEAGLFAANLYRMYSRYAQRSGWKTDVIDANQSGIGAIKEVVFEIKGQGAYSRLKYEMGVHRVQRIPVTESNDRIHTSTATVAVLPKAEEVDVDIHPDDLQIDIFHASGHGGQNVQKVATAVRITHKPTGVVAICQDERSQFKNKEKAMAVIRSRVLAREVERQHRERSDARRTQIGTGERSGRVRTYNFPQSRMTDHRIGLTLYNLDQVMDGEIDEIIEALVQNDQAQRLDQVAR